MTQPQDPMQQLRESGLTGDEAAAQAERVNHALRGYGVPAPMSRPPAVQPKPKGTIKITSFLIIVGALTLYVLATHFGWYDQLPSWLDDFK